MTESTPPAWLYHPEKRARIFETKSEIEAALAEGWFDSPVQAAQVAVQKTLAEVEALGVEAPKPRAPRRKK